MYSLKIRIEQNEFGPIFSDPQTLGHLLKVIVELFQKFFWWLAIYLKKQAFCALDIEGSDEEILAVGGDFYYIVAIA